MNPYYVYILASKKDGVLYIGVTNNLALRTSQHKSGEVEGFTKKYFVHKLVHYEMSGDINSAIAREKDLKKWKREWKINLIEKENPDWRDLSLE
jgi:putative endonuclease